MTTEKIPSRGERMTVSCSAIAAIETSTSEDCPRGRGRNGCGTIRSAGKLVRMPYAICRLVPELISKLNHPRRARRRRQMRCGRVAKSDGPLPVPGEDKRLPDRPATNTTPPTIANAEATATAGDEIIIDERRLISELRFAAMLGYSPRTLQRWRNKHRGPPSTKIGRRLFYEINEVQEWIEEKKSR